MPAKNCPFSYFYPRKAIFFIDYYTTSKKISQRNNRQSATVRKLTFFKNHLILQYIYCIFAIWQRWIKVVLFLLYNTPSSAVYALLPAPTFIAARPVQPANTPGSMFVTLSGIVTLPVRPVHPENAPLRILVTLLGIVMLVRPVQLRNA